MVEGYCLKEKKKVEMKDPKFELNKKGRPIARGTCSSCGGVVYKILKATEVPADLKAKVAAKKGGASRKRRSKKSRSKSPARRRKSRKSKKSRSRSRKSRH
jgi:hypothetical protein